VNSHSDFGYDDRTINIVVVIVIIIIIILYRCLQCFDAVGWTAGKASGLWWGVGMVICLERDADLHMAQLMPLPLASGTGSPG